MRIDPTRTWRRVEARLAVEGDPRRRRNLEVVLAHMKAEAEGDLEGLMKTVAEKAHYHAYAGPPEMSPKGRAAVRGFYEAFLASGCQRLELDVDRLVVDEDCVVTEGRMRIAYPGAILALMGHPVEDPSAHYLYEARMCVLWPFDAEGLLLGEDTYVAGDGFEGILDRKLDPGGLDGAGSAAS